MKWWDVIDILSVKPELFLKGKYRYHNLFGGILSILTYLLILLLTIYLLIEWINGNGLNIVFLSRKKPFYSDSSFSLKDTPIMWSLVYNYNEIVDPSYFSIKPFLLKFQEGDLVNHTKLEIVSCNEIKSFNKSEIINSLDFDLTKYNCIKDKNDEASYNVSSVYEEKSMTFLTLKISACENSTDSNITCKSSEDIINFFTENSIEYIVVTPSYTLDHFNLKHPIQTTISEDRYHLKSDICIQRNEYIKPVKYSDDQGIILKSLIQSENYDRDSQNPVKETETKLKDSTYGIHTISITGENEDFYNRTYPKLQNIIANIGGIASLLINIASIIAKYISGQMFNLFMGNFMFDLSNGLKQVNNNLNLLKNHSGNKNCSTKNTSNKNYESEQKVATEIKNPINKSIDQELNIKEIKYELYDQIKSDNIQINQINNNDNVIIQKENNKIENTNQDTLLNNNNANEELSLYNVILLRNKIISKMQLRKLSFYDALCCKIFSRNFINKTLVDPCGIAFRHKFSCDNIIAVLSEYENLKKVLLDEDERYLFKFVQLPSIFEFNVSRFNRKFEFQFDEFKTILNRNINRNERITRMLNSI